MTINNGQYSGRRTKYANTANVMVDAQAAASGSLARDDGVVPESFYGLHRWPTGTGYSSAPVGGSGAFTTTFGLKMETEAGVDPIHGTRYGFNSVRLMIASQAPNATTGWNAIVAVTDTASTDTLAERCQPMLNGTAYNSIRSGATREGWAQVTWNGGNTTASIPGGGSYRNPKFIVSDPVPLVSVPRKSGETSKRELVLARAFHDALTAGELHSVDTSGSYYSHHAVPDQYNLGRIFDVTSVNGNGITTLGATMTNAGGCFFMYPIIEYSRPVVNIGNFGDSTFQWPTANWLRYACFTLSRPFLPIIPMMNSAGTRPGVEYAGHMRAIFDAGLAPQISIYEANSPNDINLTASTLAQVTIDGQFARIREFLDLCGNPRRRSIPIVTTALPCSLYNTAELDARRKAVNDFVRRLGQDGQCIVADFAEVVGTGTVPEGWKVGHCDEEGTANPLIHPSLLGHQKLAQRAAIPAIQKALAYLP